MKINDGHWHQVGLERHGNSAKILIDNKYEAQGSAPGINDALDAPDKNLIFGNNKHLNKPFHGCLDNLKMDDIPMNGKTSIAEILEEHQVQYKCDAKLESPGICGSQPCLSGGTCHDNGTMYHCTCLERYQGTYLIFLHFKNANLFF